MISVAALIAAGINPTAAKIHAPHLAAAAARFGIDTPRKAAAFVGQAAVETQGLTKFEENLFYSSPERIREIFRSRVQDLAVAGRLARNPQGLANWVYANRYGNGGPETGDGWRYRGRGAGHLTFCDNYAAAAAALGRPYVDQPDLVAQPEDAALTFAHYFATRGCMAPAEAWNIDAVTKAVNPGMAAAAERREWCAHVLGALRVPA